LAENIDTEHRPYSPELKMRGTNLKYRLYHEATMAAGISKSQSCTVSVVGMSAKPRRLEEIKSLTLTLKIFLLILRFNTYEMVR
jgi:hypothetical protein